MKNELYSFETVGTACAPVGPRSRAASQLRPASASPRWPCANTRALAPSHFPQFPLNPQNVQKSPYSRAFCVPNARNSHTIPTLFSLRARCQSPYFLTPPTGGRAPALSTFFTFSTQHKNCEKTYALFVRKRRIPAIPAYYHNSHSTQKISKKTRITRAFYDPNAHQTATFLT